MNKWIAEFELEDGDTMPEHMDLEYKGARIDFHCKPLKQEPTTTNDLGVDVVSREAVLDLIADYDLSMGQVVRGIHALPSVTPQEPRWIPVNEKLPEIQNYSDNYLVTLKRGGVHIAMFTECDGKHWWTYDDVVAWMPLPKPMEVGE